MRTSFFKLLPALIAALLLSFNFSPAQAAQLLTVHIDGKLNDAAWKKAQPLAPFKKLDGTTPQAKTTGLVLTDSQYLYLAFRCEEPLMNKLEAVPQPRDGKIWTNDCIEVFIAPFQRQDEYFQIVVDVAGQVYDAFKRDGKQDANYDFSVIAQAYKQQNEWTLEIAIPLAEVGLSGARNALVNFARERKAAPEDSTWHGQFSKPETWRTMPLELDKRYGADIRNWDHGMETPQYGHNTFTLDYTPTSTTPSALVLSIWKNGKWNAISRQTVRGAPGSPLHIALPYQLHPQDKPQVLRATLEAGEHPVFRLNYRLLLPAQALTATPTVPYFYAEESAGFIRFESFLTPADLQKSELRLTVKSPDGKVRATKTVTALQKSMLVGFDLTAWHSGTGQVLAELVTDGELTAKQQVAIPKRRGPFAHTGLDN